jgi:hypothetical protein
MLETTQTFGLLHIGFSVMNQPAIEKKTHLKTIESHQKSYYIAIKTH